MIPLFIASNTGYSGRTFVALGLALKLAEMDYSVGYVRPVGKTPVKRGKEVYDADALFIAETLGLQEPLDVVSPFVMSYENQTRLLAGGLKDVKKQVIAAVRSLKKKDYVIIGGAGDLFEGAPLGLDALSLTAELKARVIMVEPWRGEVSADALYGAARIFGDRFCGGVINKVPESIVNYAKQTVKPFLEKNGAPVFGVFPKDKFLESVTVRELNDILNGKVLCCEDRLDEHVENYLIGAMDVDSALNYFRRTPNKAVITGAHRSDIQLAAMETATKCIILTGGFLTNETVLGKARQTGTPIITVADDTFSTINRIDERMGKTSIRDAKKVQRAKDLIGAEFDLFRLLQCSR
jgi:BioD-like phosphotransacetylase family protein